MPILVTEWPFNNTLIHIERFRNIRRKLLSKVDPSSMTQSLAPPPDSRSNTMILQRRSQITELVRQTGAVRVNDLAKRFNVSEVTIRNDLMQLEKQGQLVRDRGGAFHQITYARSQPFLPLSNELTCRLPKNSVSPVPPLNRLNLATRY